jgi:hypothetical protein
VHRVEGVVPAWKVRLEADDELGLGKTGIEQVDHPFPDRIVVAEGSLKPDVLLNKRIEIDWNLIGRPADLDHLAIRAHQLQGHVEWPARA